MSTFPAPPAEHTFRHGVHPDEHKHYTAGVPLERMPWVEEYVLPLAQHIGAPSKSLVTPGMRVERGQLLAKAGGFVSVALHAPVTGTVTAIELRPHPNGSRQPAIVIKADPYASQRMPLSPPVDVGTLTPDEFARRVQEAGIVGLGGATFPAHVKLKVPPDKRAQFVILNGCECEPFLTCDHRVMLEESAKVLRGLRIIMRQVGAKSGYVGVELNKADAIEALRAAVVPGEPIEIVGLQVKYPQGAEKMLIDAIFHRAVPIGKLPLDLEMVVHNVATAGAIADLFDHGTPLVERVVTVSGPGIRRPANLVVPLGTPVRAVVEYCGGLLPETKHVVLGGPMMGMSQKTLDVPVTKGTSGILALTGGLVETYEEQPCIRCGRCLEACPMFLNPSQLATFARAETVELMESYHALDCFECGSCSFVCPSHIPIVQLIRVGKAEVRRHQQQKKAP